MKHNLLRLKLWLLFACLCLAGISAKAQMYAKAAVAQSGGQSAMQNDSEQRSLSRILFKLEDSYHVSFNYDDEAIGTIYPGAGFLLGQKENLEKVLQRLFASLNLKFERLDKRNYLILDKSKKAAPVNAPKENEDPNGTNEIQSSAEEETEYQTSVTVPDIRISGTVREENGDALPGVNIIVKGTNTGATSDADGKYVIEVQDESAVLVFSFVGYASKEIAVSNNTTIDVTLAPDIQSLAEVVVMGYNTQEKRDITGSVVTVKADELKSVPNANFANQLQGRAAGVMVSNDNTPGGGVSVRIRGVGSITGNNEPLYVIDGVPTTTGGLNQINPNDIETMQVLKDASAASIYGARANNGVIVITTKKGKQGTTKVSYNMYEGVQVPNKGPDLLNTQQFIDILWADKKSQGLTNPDGTLITPDPRFGAGVVRPDGTVSGVAPDYIISSGSIGRGVNANDPLFAGGLMSVYGRDPSVPGFGTTKFQIMQVDKNGHDWYDEIYASAPIRNHNVTVSGGSEGGRFAVSADYFQQNGIVIDNSFKRYSIRANTEFNVKKVIRIGENIQLAYTDNVGIGNARSEFSPVSGFNTSPYMVPFDIAGNYAGNRLGGDHAVSTLERAKDNHSYNTRIFGNLYAEIDILKRITARTSVGIDYGLGDFQGFSPKSPESNLKSQQDVLNFNWSKSQNFTWTNTLNYQQEFGSHALQVLVGTEAVTSKYRYVNGDKNTLAFVDPSFQYFNSATQIGSLTGLGSEASLFSIFGKVDYKFRDRYMLSATLRRDGSSRFAPANRYGVFPAFSVGWLASEELFMQSVSWINLLKVRGGWGITGNQDIDEYNQYATYVNSLNASSYPVNGGINGGGNLYPGYQAGRSGNPFAQWEEQSMANVGIDLTIFNRLTFTIEGYNRTTGKLLLAAPRPATEGANAVPASNVGEVRNKGIELSLNYDGSTSSGLTYGIGVNWSTYRNEVTALYSGNPFIQGPQIRNQIFTRTMEGEPMSSFYGMVTEGVFTSQEEADAWPTQFGNRALYNQPGRFKYKNIVGDSVIDGKDVQIIGNPHPKFTYGINLTAGFKGFDFTLFLFGVYGNDIYNFRREGSELMLFEGNKSTAILNYWSPTNPTGTVPTPNGAAAQQEYYRVATYFIEDGSYLRAKNLTIGYTFPTKWISAVSIDRLRLYVQASNLFTVTKYTGLDPEVNLLNYNTRGNETDRGVDRGVYPAAKVFMIGAQVSF